MSHSKKSLKPSVGRFSFGLRALFGGILIAALSIVAVSWYLEIRNTNSLESVVEQFNVIASDHYIGAAEPPLTSDEVTEYLQSKDQILLEAPPAIKAVYRKIIRTKRIPVSAELDYVPSNGSPVWWIALEVDGGDTRYRVNIRENYNPKVKSRE